MISRSSDSKLWSYLRRSLRRTAIIGQVTTQGLGTLLTDYRLLARRWNNDVVFRHKRIDGFRLLVRAEEDVGRRIYYFGHYEEEFSNYLRETIKETDTCIDVGANVGYYTLLMARLARKGMVHSFEPVPLNYHLLCANLLANRIQNVVANQSVIADQEADTEFVVANDSAYSSLIDTGRKPVEARVRVHTNTLDRYCRQHQIARVDVLKIDVEGAEEKILSGSALLLGNKARQPRLMMLELYEPMLRKYGSSIDKILCLTRGYGYRPFVPSGHRLIPFVREHYNKLDNAFFLLDQSAE